MNLGEIRDSARSKADEESTGFISNTEIDRSINQGMNFIYGKIVQRFENYFIVRGTALNGGLITTVVGQQAYSLPSTMQKLLRVEHRPATSIDDNEWRRLENQNINNDAVNDYYPVRPGYAPYFGYFIAGDTINLRPVPKDSFSIRIWFIPRVTQLVDDTDVAGIPSEYHELIAEYAACQCLRKSGEGIFRENFEMFQLELNNMLETIEIRDQQAEQMMITEAQDLWLYGI